ncbi:MAG: class I SAM-dependent methyltransferase [Alphaproteobacteria bacterium]|nr:class I SAM-dependent methyltransferase [Alphaproteobacteria bacterium]
MTAIATATAVLERLPVPDALMRAGIAHLVGRTHRRMVAAPPGTNAAFAAAMRDFPIAEHAAEANAQHYELPEAFFGLVLGPYRKYSSCYYRSDKDTLAEAEAQALAATCIHAGLLDGQEILELGCGWGSLSLWMAARYPNARITAVSNSHSQRAYITETARARGIGNLTVVTADMNGFETAARFDRIVSVEMFEHMANWDALLARARGWLRPDGRLFLHVFTHAAQPYRFDWRHREDWIAQHFFTGGIMPSHGLIRQFPHLFAVEEEWRWDGRHYQRTARDWLANYDRHAAEIEALMQGVYGNQSRLWQRRWRLFFLAVEGLFGYAKGSAWGVSHYRLAPAS